MSPLRSFVDDHLGDVEVVRRPRVGGGTRVVQVRDASGREWFAKRLLFDRRWRAESSAHRLWATVPEVVSPVATCEDRQCLLLARAPGVEPTGSSRRVLRAAGSVLRTLHESPAPEEWSSTWRTTTSARVDRLLADLPRRGIPIDRGLVRSRHDELVSLDLTDVPTHGDYQPHNWLVRRGRISVLDLEWAALRPAVFDLSRLRYAACWRRPDLFGALLQGYGRDLSATELRFLEAVLPWWALVAIDLGLRRQRPEMVAHGRLVLEELPDSRPRTT